MIRLIKRYGGTSRKLYDTEESRYVSLDELAAWIRAGQQLQVLDGATGEEVTARVLAQAIYEDQGWGHSLFSGELQHELIRRGNQVIARGIGQIQARLGALVRGSVKRLLPVGGTQEDLDLLRQRVAELESALAGMAPRTGLRTRPGRPRAARNQPATTNPAGQGPA